MVLNPCLRTVSTSPVGLVSVFRPINHVVPRFLIGPEIFHISPIFTCEDPFSNCTFDMQKVVVLLSCSAFSTSKMLMLSEVESSRTSLASRTSSRSHFKVLGLEGQVLGLKSSKIGLSSARGQHYFLNC